jgi:putative ABC transport system ATP-binding protein
MNDILELKNVCKTYHVGNKEIYALKDFTYTFKKGSFNIITGPSGSGKSTFIRVAGLLEKPSKGNVLIKGKDLNLSDEKERASFIQNEIGFVFQNSNLIPSLTVLENLMLPMPSKEAEKAKLLLQKVEFQEFNKFPKELSFEEQQRITIARAMINNHFLILADEPTGELHIDEAVEIIDLLLNLSKKEKLTIIMVTNNNLLSQFGENVIEIIDGTNIR